MSEPWRRWRRGGFSAGWVESDQDAGPGGIPPGPCLMRTDVLQCWKRKQGQDSPRGNGTMTKEEALKTYYGYDVFRGGQEAVIDALLSGRDALAIMPTGAGKSALLPDPGLAAVGDHPGDLASDVPDAGPGDGSWCRRASRAAFLNSSLTVRQYAAGPGPGQGGAVSRSSTWPRSGWRPRASLAFVREADHLPGGGGRGPLHLPVGTGFPALLSEHSGLCGQAAPPARRWAPSPPRPRRTVQADIAPLLELRDPL